MSAKSRKTAPTDYRAESPAPAIPWSEWTDVELNAEKWDFPKNGSDGHFLDPEPRLMPPSIQPYDWKRGSSLRNLSSNPVVFAPSNEYPDFVKNNKHILHSQFVRWFISAIINLQYAGRDGLKLEGESANFTWLDKSRWEGWMNVYSMNKAGNSAPQHRPIVNPNGKYVVRLFFMGTWRRFIIDDMIPVDEDGSPLLPRTERDFELWPMILSKALMKLAALSWTGQQEIADFYPVSCLTGWICLPLITKPLSQSEKWKLLTKYVDGEGDDKNPTKEDSHCTVAMFANLSNALETIPDVTPYLSHLIFIDKVKDMTLDTSQSKHRWKLYRYFDWTSKHGMIGSGTEPEPATRCLKLIVPLRRCSTEEPSIPRDEMSPEIGVWIDFIKIAPYLDEIFMFYKPSDFQYYTRVSDVLRITTADSKLHISAGSSRIKSQKDDKKAQTGFQSSLKWQQNVSNFKTDPLYMLIDSIDAKFVLIEFCSMPQPNVASTKSYLIVEGYNFFRKSTDDDPAASLETFSTGATIFEAEPGRHLYRVLFKPGYSYSIRILSNTIFHLGDRFRIYELMGFESDRIDTIVKNISDRIGVAFHQFGKPGYANELRSFYKSYMPLAADILRSNVEKRLVKNLHQLFITEFVKTIKETFSAVETTAIGHSLRVFFLDPSIGVRHEYNKSKIYDPEEFSIAERSAAVKIQSFFRMSLVKIYKKIHDPSHVRHSEILQRLRKVVELFNYSQRESIAHLLLRRIIWNTCTETHTPLYPIIGDLDQVLNTEEWKGVVRNVKPDQWVPVLRVIVNAPREDTTVYAGLDFVTSLPRYVIRIINNETYREVKRFATKLTTAHYPYVKLGYTVIGYGWSDGYKFKELDWCVRVTTVKGRPTFVQMSGSKSLSLGSKPPSLVIHELSNNYIPNLKNLIGKWIVTVSIDSLVSLRLSTSYNMVESEIKIYDNDGNVLCQANGGSILILPIAYLSSISGRDNRKGKDDDLKVRNRSKSSIPDSVKDREDSTTEYSIQAYVANHSWPLTSIEWTVVNEAKAKGTVYDPRYGRTSVSSSSKRGLKSRVQTGRGSEEKLHVDNDVTSGSTMQTIFQHPLCSLQILVDVGSKVHIEEDKRREIEISDMKKLWEDAEPDRLLRGRYLREEFFKSNSAILEAYKSRMNSTQDIRTLKPSLNLSGIIPPWKTTKHFLKQDDDESDDYRWLKTEDDEEMLRNQRAINSIDFNNSLVYREEELHDLLEDQRQRYSNILNTYMNKITNWKILTDAVYAKREIYISDVKSTMSNSVNKNEKDTKKKNKTNKRK